MTAAQRWCFYLLLFLAPAAGLLGVPLGDVAGVWGFGANVAGLGLCVTLCRVALGGGEDDDAV